LAFDQLEGLRDKKTLTSNWGDVVREIFTMAPNLVILTCIFPDLWGFWFSTTLDQSVVERIAQSKIELETFSSQHGRKFLETYMGPLYRQFRLPSPIYPFANDDVDRICAEVKSPRQFLQKVNNELSDWIFTNSAHSTELLSKTSQTPSREEIDKFISQRLNDFKEKERDFLTRSVPIEDDYFGRLKTVFETIVVHSSNVEFSKKATCGNRVMPKNVVLRDTPESSLLCIGILNGEGISFSARIKNMRSILDNGQFDKAIILRDKQCKELGERSRENIELYKQSGGMFYKLDLEESIFINAIYDTLIAIEESDMTLHSYKVSKQEFIDYLFAQREFSKCCVFQRIFEILPSLGKSNSHFPSSLQEDEQYSFAETSYGDQDIIDSTDVVVALTEKDFGNHQDNAYYTSHEEWTDNDPKKEDHINVTQESDTQKFVTDIVIGNKHLDVAQSGILGKLKQDGKCVAFSFSKPMCALIIGYMGSGKSYALGVLMENALMNIKNISWNPRPTCVIAFNYRRNAESRFEYRAFTQPNSNIQEVKRLVGDYAALPKGIDRINVLGYGPELERRRNEYGNASLFPIKFLPQELSAEHWEILMKPPSSTTEYMSIARKIIQDLFYENRLTFANLRRAIEDHDGLTPSQRQRLDNRLKFAETWISDQRNYDWADVFTPGTLTVFDLRMQALSRDDALRLCLILTDIVRKTSNGVNKTIIFDEAHEYVDSKDLIDELENAITQIRHDGLSFILASQFPERIPQTILKYLLTRMIFKITDQKSINSLRGSAPNLSGLSPIQVSNLNTEAGECFLQSDDDCTDVLLRKPQLFAVRPRCSQHGGATKRS